MTQTEQAMEDLRNAVKAEMIEAAREWWTASKETYLEGADAEGAVSDLLITLEQA